MFPTRSQNLRSELQATNSPRWHQSPAPPDDVDICDYVVQNLARLNLTGQGVVRLGDFPMLGGSFADIWRGKLQQHEIAIKVPRIFRSPSPHEKKVLSLPISYRQELTMK